jgi:2,3-bisphosphoglycerate-dependent phosphoglycerate mutase
MKQFYLVRHCKAEGQELSAKLTEVGYKQSLQLAEFLSDKEMSPSNAAHNP